MKTRILLCSILTSTCLLLYSCQPQIDFTQSKKANNASFSSMESITSYKLRFNLKANGAVVIILNNGAEYKADKLNAAQLSSLLTLLHDTGLQFDTKNEEFVLNQQSGHENN